METMLANGEESVAQYERGEITKEEAQAHHAKVHDAMVDYASTLEGAEDYRADAADAQALADQTRDPEDEFVAAHLRSLVDEGAQRAQVNREVENAYRASQGQPPLTTPVPQTFAQEAEAQAAAEQAAAEKATKDADPFGLRAAAATADPSKGFAVETTFDAPNPLPQQPPATTGEWTFQPSDVPAAIITPENGHGFGNPDNHYRLSTGLGISPQELQRISDEALETSGYGQALRDAGLLAPQPAAPSGSGRGFSAETTFDAPNRLPQRPPATTGEWTFESNDVDPVVVTAEELQNRDVQRPATATGASTTPNTRTSAPTGMDPVVADTISRVVQAAGARHRDVLTRTLAGAPSIRHVGTLSRELNNTILESPDAPHKGIRNRLNRKADIAAATAEGEAAYGPAFTEAVRKYEGRFDARQIAVAAARLDRQASIEALGDVREGGKTGLFDSGLDPDYPPLHAALASHIAQQDQSVPGDFNRRYVAANLEAALDAVHILNLQRH